MLYQTLSAPISCQIELTTSCNHNCSHCYNFWRKDLKRDDTSFTKTTISQIVKKLEDAKVFDIIITGGEPLMSYDVLIHCIKEAQRAGLGVSLNSNLVPLTRSRARELRSMGVRQILTSLMGPSAEIHDSLAQSKGSFDRVVRKIRLAQEEGIRVAVNMVVSRANRIVVRDTARLVSSLGVKMFTATKAGCPGNCQDFSEFSLSKTEFRQYLVDLQEIGGELNLKIDALEGYPLCGIGDLDLHYLFIGRKCFAGVTTMTVASDGEVRPCSHLDISYGNLLREELSKIWMRMSDWRDGTYLPEVCKICKLLPACGGGCRMEAKMASGSLNGEDPYSSPGSVDESLSSLQVHRARMPKEGKKEGKVVSFEIRPYRHRPEPFGVTVLAGKSRAFLSLAGFEVLKQFQLGIPYFLRDEGIRWGSLDPATFIGGLIKRGIAVEK